MPDTRWSQIGAVRVRSSTGEIDNYPNLIDAVRGVGWYAIDRLTDDDLEPDQHDLDVDDLDLDLPGLDPVLTGLIRVFDLPRKSREIVFLDHLGLVIPMKIVRRVAMEQNLHTLPYFWCPWLPRDNPAYRAWGYEFRSGPVPGTRCTRSSERPQPMRRVCAIQEIRENKALEYDVDAIEHNVKGRARRSSIPPAWHDRPIGDWKARSWKSYWDTQWKAR